MAEETTPAETTAIFADMNETMRQVQESLAAMAGAMNQNVTLSEKERAERQKLIDQAKADDSIKRTNDLLKEYGVTLERVTEGEQTRTNAVKRQITDEQEARNQLLQTLEEEGVIRADATDSEKEALITKLELQKLELKRKKAYEDSVKQLGYMFDQNGKIVKQTKLLTDEQDKEIAALKKKKEEEDKLKQATENVKESLNNLGKDLLKLGLTTAFDFLKASVVGTYKAQVAYEDALLDGATGYSVQAAAISAKMEEMAGAMDNLGGGLVSMGSQLAATGLELVLLGGPIGILAIAIGGLLVMLGYEAKVEAENMKRTAELKKKQAALFDELFKDFGALGEASMGSSRGMMGLRDDLSKVGLTIKEFDKLNTVLKANAKEMSMLGAGTVGGIKNFLDVTGGLISSELGKTFREMGIDRDAMMEHTAKYMAQEQRFGLMQKKSVEDQARAAGAYVVELDKMATLTGATRKEQESAREAVMQIQSLRAAMMKAKASGNTEEAERLKRYLDVATAFQQQGMTEQAKGTVELAAGKGPTSQASAMVMQASPQMIEMLDKNIGTATERYAVGLKEFKAWAINFADAASVGADMSKIVGDYGKIDDANIKLEQLIELQKKNPEKSLDQLLVEMRKNDDPETKKRVAEEEKLRKEAIETQDKLLSGQALASQEMTGAGGIMSKAGKWLIEAADKLKDWAMGVWERSGGEALFKKAFDSLVDALKPLEVVIQPLVDTLTWLTEGAIKTLAWSLDFISQGLKVVAQLLTGDISGAFKTFINGLKFGFEGLANSIEWLANGFMKAGMAIAHWTETLANGIKKALSDLVDGIMSILPSWAKPSSAPAATPAPATAAPPAQSSTPAAKRAKGGIVPGSAEGTTVTVGEAGKPEAILPLDSMYQQNAALIKAVNATTTSVDRVDKNIGKLGEILGSISGTIKDTKTAAKPEAKTEAKSEAKSTDDKSPHVADIVSLKEALLKAQSSGDEKETAKLKEYLEEATKIISKGGSNDDANKKIQELVGFIKISPPDQFANPENDQAAARIKRQGAPKLAEGGVVPGTSTGTTVTVGEKGNPEAIVPLDMLKPGMLQNAEKSKDPNADAMLLLFKSLSSQTADAFAMFNRIVSEAESEKKNNTKEWQALPKDIQESITKSIADYKSTIPDIAKQFAGQKQLMNQIDSDPKLKVKDPETAMKNLLKMVDANDELAGIGTKQLEAAFKDLEQGKDGNKLTDLNNKLTEKYTSIIDDKLIKSINVEADTNGKLVISMNKVTEMLPTTVQKIIDAASSKTGTASSGAGSGGAGGSAAAPAGGGSAAAPASGSGPGGSASAPASGGGASPAGGSSGKPGESAMSKSGAAGEVQTGSSVNTGKEIHTGGTVSWRTNNPGNVSYGDLAKQYGAIGTWKNPDGDQQQKTTGIAIMPSIEDGDKLKMGLWKRPMYIDKTIDEGVAQWTGTTGLGSAYAKDLANAAGATMETKIRALSESQLMSMVTKQRQWEGFKPGKVEPVAAFDGGVFEPKPGGVHVNLAEAGLREAAVPLNPGEKIRVEKSEQENNPPKKEPLSTVMAPDTPASSNSNQSADILAALHELMESKFDSMISALRDGNDISDKILKYSQV